jgi:hypothetical protein
MKDLVKLISDFWEVITLTLTGLGGIFAFLKNRKDSTALLYEELEKLKLQVIAQVQKDVKDAKELAEAEQIINELKLRCPDCYNQYIKDKKGE